MRDHDHRQDESAKDPEKETIEMTDEMKEEEEIPMNEGIGQERDTDEEVVTEAMIADVRSVTSEGTGKILKWMLFRENIMYLEKRFIHSQ